jgi:tRNA-splicing ligase RtcB
MNYELIEKEGSATIKAWVKGVPFEDMARDQLAKLATLPFIHSHLAVMADVHGGLGSTVGSVIPTVGAIIPAAVGVDIGCGMMAIRTSLKAEQLPDNLKELRSMIEKAVPHGRTNEGKSGDRGQWHNVPDEVGKVWADMLPGLTRMAEKYPRINHPRAANQLGTLGTGNHFIEVCLDESDCVWIMLHSGSRGVGNSIGSTFIAKAREDMERNNINLPDRDLAYLTEGADHFQEYVDAVQWAQNYALVNRQLMMNATINALRKSGLPEFSLTKEAINCHHNYVANEHHFGKDVWLARKGAVNASKGTLGIIPGSMGAKSFIVEGKGEAESFNSCSHGAGRLMSRTQAKKQFTLEDHAKATAGVECRKDIDVIDETPDCYKSIDSVMKAQEDLVNVVHTLKQVLCVKG